MEIVGIEKDFEVLVLVRVPGFGKPHHEAKLVETVADILHQRLGEEVTVERLNVPHIVLS